MIPNRDPKILSAWVGTAPRRRAVLLGTGLLAVLLIPGLALLETDNSPEVFFVHGSEDVDRYREFRDEFGSDLIVRLVARTAGSGDGGLWTSEGLSWLAEIETRVARMPGVESVFGLYGHHRRTAWPQAGEAVGEFRRQVLTNELDRAAGWVSADGSTVTATVVLEESSLAEERELFDRLRGVLATAPEGVVAELAGPPLLNHALDDSSREIERRYFPLLVAFSVLLLTATLRSATAFLTPLLFVGLCELLVLAPMGYAGIELNMVLAVLPPLLFAIALATALHVLLRFRDLRDGSRTAGSYEACFATYREKGWSILWTGLTTLIAFASLTLSPVAPVRSLGTWAAIGLGLMTVSAFVVYPALLTLPPAGGSRRPRAFERKFHRLGARWGRWAGRRPGRVLLIAAAVAILAAAGWPRIRVQSNALHYLAPSHPVRAQVENLERAGIGLAAVEVVITPPGAAPFAEARQVARLAELGDRLEEEPLIFGTLSAGGVLRDAADRIPAPFLGTIEHLELVFRGLRADAEGRRAFDRLVSTDLGRARMTVFLATVGLDEIEPLLDSLRSRALACFPGAEVEVTGEFPLLLEAQRHLLSTLAVSLGLTLIAVAVVLRVVLPGTRLALLALLPNLWPVAGTLGLMGWLEVPLDIATVMVASVVLGLAVDDTLHTLGHFRRLAPSAGAREAVAGTLEVTAPAYVLTGVILAAGFGVCALSDFAPIARFGALSAFAVGLAVLGDLFLLPALLSLTPRVSLERWQTRC